MPDSVELFFFFFHILFIFFVLKVFIDFVAILLLFYFFVFCFFSGPEAYGNIAWPGIKSTPSALEGEVWTPGLPGKSL